MSKDISGPAFPTDAVYEGQKGMTLRQYAAIKAMEGLLSDGEVMGHLTAYSQQQKKPLQEIVAVAAVNYDDALLAEMEK